MNLTSFGVWNSIAGLSADEIRDAAQLVEQLGYGTWWAGGSPEVDDVRPLLEATSTLVAATGILNVWSAEPVAAAAAAAALRADFPERFMLGIGIGHPEATSDYRRPLASMRKFLDGLDAAVSPPPPEERCLAALGPRMLDLAGERTAGTHTYFVPVQHTRWARERLGAGRLIAVEIACVVDPEPERARATAREYARFYLGLSNYTANLKRFGFDESDFADGGSDRLIDTIVPHGDVRHIAEAARAQLEAGADHVCLQPLEENGLPRRSWTELADALR